MSDLSLDAQQQLTIFKRQYFQLQTAIRYPVAEVLRQDHFQQALHNELFSKDKNGHQPPQRYQLRILKELVSRIESSIVDWDEEVRNSFGFCA